MILDIKSMMQTGYLQFKIRPATYLRGTQMGLSPKKNWKNFFVYERNKKSSTIFIDSMQK